jgi:MFS family permease
MPKVFDERLQELTHTTIGIGALVSVVYTFAALAQLLVGRLIDKYPIKSILLPIVLLQAPLLFLSCSAENWAMLTAAVTMMFFVFGQIPINDAMVARYTADEWRSRVFALRYVVSFGASALAVPLIAVLHRADNGFREVFLALAAVALCTLAASFLLPSPSRERAAAALLAQPAAGDD